MSNELTIQNDKSVSLFDANQFGHWMNVAKQLSTSAMIPKNFTGKPMDIMVAMEMGRTIGLSMIQSLQCIAVINGRPSMWGDAVLAVCQGHPSHEWLKEEPIYKGSDIAGYKCTVKRRNQDAHIVVFMVEDAKKAGLWGKAGPWSAYPARMLQMRARGFALRDVYADALQGIHIAEESQDLHIIEGEKVKVSQADKMSALLSKKGLSNNEKKITHDTNSCTLNHSDVIDITDRVHAHADVDSKPTMQANDNAQVDGLGAQEDSSSNAQVVSGQVTAEQLDAIDCLMHEKKFDLKRKQEALKHFDILTFDQMSFEQGQEMIKILKKIDVSE
jgi:hypothetical protein